MSAWLVNKETIVRVIDLYKLLKGAGVKLSLPKEVGITSTLSLARSLHQMNLNALWQRYGDDPARVYGFKASDFGKENTTMMQRLKSLHCLRYQCGEGGIPDSSFYKWLEKFVEAADEYLHYTPTMNEDGTKSIPSGVHLAARKSYDEAMWG